MIQPEGYEENSLWKMRNTEFCIIPQSNLNIIGFFINEKRKRERERTVQENWVKNCWQKFFPIFVMFSSIFYSYYQTAWLQEVSIDNFAACPLVGVPHVSRIFILPFSYLKLLNMVYFSIYRAQLNFVFNIPLKYISLIYFLRRQQPVNQC